MIEGHSHPGARRTAKRSCDSISLVVVHRKDLLRGDPRQASSVDSGGPEARSWSATGPSPALRSERSGGGGRCLPGPRGPGRSGTIRQAPHLLADQIGWRDHLDFLDNHMRRQVIDRRYPRDGGLVACDLVQAMAEAIRDRPDTDRDMERWKRSTRNSSASSAACGERMFHVRVIRDSATYAFTAWGRRGRRRSACEGNPGTASWIVASGKGSRMMNSRNVSERPRT